MSQTLPVTILTGFLGSGKTTLLNHLVGATGAAKLAVLINEFGEVAIDHLLVRKIDESTVVLNSGCLCCTIRDDLSRALRDLFLKRVRGEVPEFERVIVETTGLADPAPILHTLMTDPLLGARYRLDGIVTTVDAVNGADQLDRQPEAVKQAAVADRLLVTKCDLAPPASIQALEARLRDLNPGAPLHRVAHGIVAPDLLFDAGLFNPKSKIPDVENWLHAEAVAAHHHHHHDINRHDAHIRACVLIFEKPLVWEKFVAAIELLIATQGDKILRLKGILALEGEEVPVAIHGVQHLFHPPAPLPAWPDADRRSKLVLILRDLAPDTVKSLFQSVAA